MPQNFFITGMPKAGKTTLLRKLIEQLQKDGYKVGGFVSPEEKHHGTRTAFHVMDIETEKEGILASVEGDGPKVSKYHVDVKSFESIAIPLMEKCDKYDVFIIDEISIMEMKSKKFLWLLDKVFDSNTPVIASLHTDYVDKYKFSGEVFELHTNDHELVYLKLLKKAKQSLVKKPKKKIPKVKKTMARKKLVKKKTKKKTKKAKPVKKHKTKKKTKKIKKKRGFLGKVKDLLGV
ncbi:DUF2478 domain-containing protein [Candidatus Micrarchaeota archaeon]|nr:DUF2478 domain-containing protein [Candidatus Micrarchaeota archaeon]